MIPENMIKLNAEDAEKLENLVDALEEIDDVQDVYHNGDIPEEDE
jgi:transcriptional/translational regulatory protein YebC/TACO1